MQDYMSKQQKHKAQNISPNDEKLDEITPQPYDNAISPSSLADSSLKSNVSTIMRLQSLIGNQGVQRLLDSSANPLQREEEPEPELDDIDDADIDAELAELFGKHKNIPTFEAITVSTAARWSTGELEDEIQKLWRRENMSFTAAARHAAKNNTVGDDGPRATSGPEFETDTNYSQRWSVNMFAWDYQRKGDLDYIKDLIRKGSPFQKAVHEEFQKVITVENPKADDIQGNIHNAIMALWQTLDVENGEIGELVVTFSGHGGGNGISGVDWKDVTLRELMALGELANDFNVHLVYIIDSCHMGALANAAQLAALGQMNEEMSETPNADGESKAKFANEFVRKIIGLSNTILEVDWASDTWRKRRNQDNKEAYHEAVLNMGEKAAQYAEFLAGAENLKGMDKAEGVPELSELIAMANQIAEESKTASTIQRPNRHLIGFTKSVDIMLDTSNDIVNQFLVQIRAEMDKAKQENDADDKE